MRKLYRVCVYVLFTPLSLAGQSREVSLAIFARMAWCLPIRASSHIIKLLLFLLSRQRSKVTDCEAR